MTKLQIVATPIGNLKDITLRAIEILEVCDFVICEDTRVTGKLLNHLGLKKKMISLNAFDEKKNLDSLVEKIKEVENVALVSDAGTPTISDPGVRLVSFVRENTDIEVEPIPGASALVTALSASGFATSSFIFHGFLPKKKGKKTLLNQISASDITNVFYESPHRILKTLQELKGLIQDDRKIGVYKEITKLHEEFVEGSAEEVIQYFEQNPSKIKGEFVVIIDSI